MGFRDYLYSAKPHLRRGLAGVKEAGYRDNKVNDVSLLNGRIKKQLILQIEKLKIPK